MAKCEIKIEKTGTSFKVQVNGTIDEDIDLSSYALSGAQNIDFHLGGVKSINSCGIREWITWIGSAKAQSVKFHECPKIIIDQINMVQGFLPSNGSVLSFYVPYYNEDSGEEKLILFRSGKEFNGSSLTLPKDVKDSTGQAMEVDVVEAKYFKFLKK